MWPKTPPPRIGACETKFTKIEPLYLLPHRFCFIESVLNPPPNSHGQICNLPHLILAPSETTVGYFWYFNFVFPELLTQFRQVPKRIQPKIICPRVLQKKRWSTTIQEELQFFALNIGLLKRLLKTFQLILFIP